jgi:hypothetical protein
VRLIFGTPATISSGKRWNHLAAAFLFAMCLKRGRHTGKLSLSLCNIDVFGAIAT